jgi:AraC-like DNA-binding protein
MAPPATGMYFPDMPGPDTRDQTAAEALLDQVSLRVLRGLRWRDCDDYSADGLRSSFSRLLLVERTPRPDGGSLRRHPSSARVALRARTAYLIPAGLRFDLRYRRGVVMYSTYLRLDGPLGGDLLEAVGAIVSAPLQPWQLAVLAAHGEDRRRLGDALAVRAALLAALAALVPMSTHEARARGRLATRWAGLRDEIERLPPARASVTLLARRMGRSADALRKAFERDTGLTLKQVLLDSLRARLLDAVARDGEPLRAIAQRLGFADQFYFSRCFSRMVGMAPSRFRASLDDDGVGKRS